MTAQTTYPPCPQWCKSEPHDWDSYNATDPSVLYRGHDAGSWDLRVSSGDYVSVTVGALEKQGEPCPAPDLIIDVSAAGARLTIDEAREVILGLAEMVILAKSWSDKR